MQQVLHPWPKCPKQVRRQATSLQQRLQAAYFALFGWGLFSGHGATASARRRAGAQAPTPANAAAFLRRGRCYVKETIINTLAVSTYDFWKEIGPKKIFEIVVQLIPLFILITWCLTCLTLAQFIQSIILFPLKSQLIIVHILLLLFLLSVSDSPLCHDLKYKFWILNERDGIPDNSTGGWWSQPPGANFENRRMWVAVSSSTDFDESSEPANLFLLFVVLIFRHC